MLLEPFSLKLSGQDREQNQDKTSLPGKILEAGATTSMLMESGPEDRHLLIISAQRRTARGIANLPCPRSNFLPSDGAMIAFKRNRRGLGGLLKGRASAARSAKASDRKVN